MINSYEYEKFIVGETYWTYYAELTGKGTRLLYYTGLIQAKLKKRSKSGECDWEPINVNLGRTLAHNLPIYMSGYGIASCDFSLDKNEVIKHHDNLLKSWAKRLPTKERERMLSKLIVKQGPEKSKIEIDSVNWYNGLSAQEKKYIKWLKEYYSEI